MAIINFIRVWHHLCIIFLIINLINLIYESYHVKYIEKDLTENELLIYFTICTEFSEIKNKSNDEFFPINKKGNSVDNKLKIKQLLNKTINYLELKLPKFKFKLNETHLFNRHFCFNVRNQDFKDNKLYDYLSIYDIKLYLSSNDILPMYYKNVLLRKSKFKTIYLRTHQQKIMNSHKSNAECAENNLINNFDCLKDCFKNRISLDIYFDFNDLDQEIDLDLIFMNSDILTNSAAKEYCLEKCKRASCFWEITSTISVEPNSKNDSKIAIDQLLIETERLMSKFEFYMQFIGLIFLFTSTSLVHCSSIFLLYSLKKINKEQFIDKYFLKIKFTFISISLLFLVYQSWNFLSDYYHNRKYPNKVMVYDFLIEPNSHSVVICVPIQFLILNQTNLIENEDYKILTNKKFKEIENLTNDGLDKVVDKFYLKYANIKKSFKIIPSKKVIFRNSRTFKQNGNLINCFQRCFRIEINIKVDNELNKYENMIAIANLLIVFKNNNYELFLIDSSLNLSSIDLNYKINKYKILRFLSQRSLDSFKFNCTDNLISIGQFLDICISKSYFNKYSKITSTLNVIDKDNFKNLDHKYDIIKMNVSENTIDNSYFTMQSDKQIEANCKAEFEGKFDCKIIQFIPTYKRGMQKEDNNLEIEIELYHELVTESDIKLSLTNVLLNILNLESILFGTNILELLITIFKFFKKLFKLKWYSIYRHLITIICIIGFSIHLFVMFNEIFSETLIDTGSFEPYDTQIQMPNLIFCLEIEFKFDYNYLKSIKYLNKFTQHITFENVFDKIIYFNKSKFINLNLTSSNDKNIKLNYLYFLDNLKCLEIDNQIRYDEKDFYFKNDIYSLKLFLNHQFRNVDLFFFYRPKKSKQLIEIYRFNLTNSKYRLNLETFLIQIEDKFEFIKNPLRLIFKKNHINDGSLYLKNLVNNFKINYNLTTLSIPLLSSKLDEKNQLPINDYLFNQYYLQKQKLIDDQLPTTINSQRTIFNCYEQRFNYNLSDKNDLLDAEEIVDFLFGIDFQARIVKVTNELNLGKLIQNILNSFSLFWNLSILSFYKCFTKIALLFIKLYKFLIYFKSFIKSNLCR